MNVSNRLVRKRFKCLKCNKYQSKLVHPMKFKINCDDCGGLLNEISENEYKMNKDKIKKDSENTFNNNEPIRASQDNFRNFSSVYERPPSNLMNRNRERERRQNNMNNINNFTNSNNINNSSNSGSNNNNRRRVHQSSDHYNNIGNSRYQNIYSNNNNENEYNINNINYINENNLDNTSHSFWNNSNSTNNNGSNQNTRYNRFDNPNNNANQNSNNNNNQNAYRRQNRSVDNPFTLLNTIFSNVFGIGTAFGGNENNSNSNNNNGNPRVFTIFSGPFGIPIQRQFVPDDVFDPIFITFGSSLNSDFRDNFSSNFRTNFRGNFIENIIRILQMNQELAAKNAHPPTSKEALDKLKKFDMSEKYCKKSQKGVVEHPSCCICISEIENGEKTVLLPCGHMFHWKCCLNWLKDNNTCPMCRFEIKG